MLVVDKLAKAIADFASQLGSSSIGTLTQVWVPEPGEDGGVVLNTQGLPFSVTGAADLLALFRCISCKYKFSTDTTKPWLMGPVGRVYTSGQAEVSQNVQQYDQSVYIRVAEAARCQINSCMFIPIYETNNRDRIAAVMEVVQTEVNPAFSRLASWAATCLEAVGLFAGEIGPEEQGAGLRIVQPAFTASALESKIEALHGSITLPGNVPPVAAVMAIAGSMQQQVRPPPPHQQQVSIDGVDGVGAASVGATLATAAAAALPLPPPRAAGQPPATAAAGGGGEHHPSFQDQDGDERPPKRRMSLATEQPFGQPPPQQQQQQQQQHNFQAQQHLPDGPNGHHISAAVQAPLQSGGERERLPGRSWRSGATLSAGAATTGNGMASLDILAADDEDLEPSIGNSAHSDALFPIRPLGGGNDVSSRQPGVAGGGGDGGGAADAPAET